MTSFQLAAIVPPPDIVETIAMVDHTETIVACIPDVLRAARFMAETVVTILRGNRQWRDSQRRKKQSSESKSF
jgi:hypothetical protein